MSDIFKTAPAVFAVGNTYQIMVPVSVPTLMWVKVGNECFYDDSNGILRSAVSIHRMTVPAETLNRAGQYTICYRTVIERKPYYSETSEIFEVPFRFSPVQGEKLIAYQIADAHNMIDAPVAAAKAFEEKYGKLDFLILNGDVPEDSGRTENFDTIYEIAGRITGGTIPTVFSRGNHDTRGLYAENIAEYTPCENGNSFFSFRLGSIWGLVLDSGEDKRDASIEYGNTICCHAFRERESTFIESVIQNKEYTSDAITHRIVIAHNPFTRKYEYPFDIEEELFTHWASLLKEHIKPNLMICGHIHELSLDLPGCDNDAFGQPCPIAVGSLPNSRSNYFAGSGFIFEKDQICVIFNDRDTVLEEHRIKI